MSSLVSIIVIAHTNARTLPKVCSSVNENSRDGDQKILVLNNPSVLVEKFSRTLDSSWTILHESKPGPQHARNCGANAAGNDYLVFLDDDVLLPKSWIDHMLSKFTSPEIALGQGHIQFEKNPSLFWNYLRYTNCYYFYSLRKNEHISRCDTAAIIVKKNWFRAVKGFSPDLTFGEDAFFGMKLYLNGARIFFDMKYSCTQIYDPNENYLNMIRKLKKSSPSILRLKQKTYRPNYISLENFRLNRIASVRIPILFTLIHASLMIFFESSFNKYRSELTPKKFSRFVRRTKL